MLFECFFGFLSRFCFVFRKRPLDNPPQNSNSGRLRRSNRAPSDIEIQGFSPPAFAPTFVSEVRPGQAGTFQSSRHCSSKGLLSNEPIPHRTAAVTLLLLA